ncbi:Condensation domain-containing protein [Vibrio tubiashii]|uniref:Uncharacterized protein n=1 Tax=Vibrio tubiashii ATCC 19109 TaxID=1051646 RepID=F9T3E0_9VIBR|nr:hypothetical protein IX91_17575 [Vibrio tubiashii ATCC 19109]EGU57124.1 hypothetical protein VITU9109_00695 [Vibrio tubiashii ATCC 19109]EIF03305.1 hypothetical protein VT1337_14420 [Vibrio tubiashii NCIMB 1337 = ATCC 19106]
MIINQQMHNMDILNDASALVARSTSSELYQKLRELIERHDTVRKTGINLMAADDPISLHARRLLSCDFGSRASGGAIGRNNRIFPLCGVFRI